MITKSLKLYLYPNSFANFPLFFDIALSKTRLNMFDKSEKVLKKYGGLLKIAYICGKLYKIWRKMHYRPSTLIC